MLGVKLDAAEVTSRNLMKFYCFCLNNFSQNLFYAIMVKIGTIRRIDFLEVLKALRFVRIKMNKQLINDYVILMDNASIHKTKTIK